MKKNITKLNGFLKNYAYEYTWKILCELFGDGEKKRYRERERVRERRKRDIEKEREREEKEYMIAREKRESLYV